MPLRSDTPVEWDEDDDIIDQLLGALGMCGCSERQPTFALVRRILRACDAHEWASIREEILPDRAHYYAILNWLDELDLIEHGTAIRCAWPTKRGLDVLDKLNEWHDAGEPEDRVQR